MLKRLIKYYKPYTWLLIVDIICVIIFSAVDIYYPYLSKQVVNGCFSTWQKLLTIGGILLALYIISFISSYTVSYVGHILGINIETDMRRDLFKKFETLDYAYFDDKKSGELLANLTSHLNEISEASHHSIEDIVSSGLIIIGSFIVCLIVNPLLTLIVSCGVISLTVFTILRRKKMMKCFRKVRVEQGELASKIESSLTGIQLTKAFNNEEFEINHFNIINSDYKKARLKQVKEISIFHSVMRLLANITNLILLIVGGIMLLDGYIEVEELLMFFLYFNNIVSPVRILASTVEQTQQAWSGYEKFYNVMVLENKIKSKDNAIIANDIKGSIDFKNVSFKYEAKNADVLKDFSLSIKPGKKIAIVGETGVGKSTISKIIPRFYDVQEGEILIDGINVKDYELKSLREKIGHVQQDVFIFYGTIKENIMYGNPNATKEQVIQASIKANLHEFVKSLPDGYDTICGERGVKLSGGQKQRVSIARIFLKNPAILILDEATSALDNVTEKLVQKSFDELALGKTTIMIAHRLTTIKDCDEIIVLTKEGIAERGTHKELVEKCGIYEKMYNSLMIEEV